MRSRGGYTMRTGRGDQSPYSKIYIAILLFAAAGSFSIGLICFPLVREWKGRIESRIAPSLEPKDSRHWRDKCQEFDGIGRTRRIVFLGDSRVEEVNWSELLDRGDISNRGIGWDTTVGILRRLSRTLPANAEYCVIQAGINDLLQGGDPDSLVVRFREILEYITKHTHAIPVVTAIIMGGTDMAALNAKVRLCNEQLKALCGSMGVPFVDLNVNLSPAGFLAQEFTRDGIHLNWKGCARVRDDIARHLPAIPASRVHGI